MSLDFRDYYLYVIILLLGGIVMSKKYLFDKINNDSYLLLLSSYDSSLNSIMKILNKKKLMDGSLIIDQLLTKGNNSNRFMKFNIKNSKIDYSSQRYIKAELSLVERSKELLSVLSDENLTNVYPLNLRKDILLDNK